MRITDTLSHPWRFLSGVTLGDRYIEVMAAADIDGVGVLAVWEKREDNSWYVWATDTEGVPRDVTVFDEEEVVPPAPPVLTPPAVGADMDAAFAQEMAGRQYGQQETADARAWFESGWRAHARAKASASAVLGGNLIWSHRKQAFYREGPGGYYTPHPAYARVVPDDEAARIQERNENVCVVPVSNEQLAALAASKPALVAVFNRIA